MRSYKKKRKKKIGKGFSQQGRQVLKPVFSDKQPHSNTATRLMEQLALFVSTHAFPLDVT